MKNILTVLIVTIFTSCDSSVLSKAIPNTDTALTIFADSTILDSISIPNAPLVFMPAEVRKNGDILFPSFVNIDWSSSIPQHLKLKTDSNVNGINPDSIPCGGDFGFPIDYYYRSLNYPTAKKIFYYLISPNGVMSIKVDSLQACISYDCSQEYKDRKKGTRYFTGTYRYSGLLIGHVDSLKQNTLGGGFILRCASSNWAENIQTEPINQIHVLDSTSLQTNFHYLKVDSIENLIHAQQTDYTIDIKLKNDYYKIEQSRYRTPKLSEWKFIQFPNNSSYLFTSWIDDETLCEQNYELYQIQNDSLLRINYNAFGCDI